MNTQDFKEFIWEKGKELYRTMPWREDTRPYYVLVSEIMLQQTQVERVIPKFEAFIRQFPDVTSLAKAPLSEVLAAWSGLGYNRRAKFLHQAAKMVVETSHGVFPRIQADITALPGVGVNTAGALLAYSFNEPVSFIETNVRTVYFYHFFSDQDVVTDAELRPLVEDTVDQEHPREWYWALMDYGAYLKRKGVRLNSKSHHYKKQAPLKGSVREVRGQILRQLTSGTLTREALEGVFKGDIRFLPALNGLLGDGLIEIVGEDVRLSA